MEWLVTAVGFVPVALVLRDVFHTILHPAGGGHITRSVFRAVWQALHALPGDRPLTLAGPLAFVATVAVWTLTLVFGFALVYWQHLDARFGFASRLDPDANTSLLDSVYFSFVTLATLGYGDITPSQLPFRLFAPIQSILGFALLSAAISWLLELYPALQRRRTLAATALSLQAAERETGADPSPQLLESLSTSVDSAHVDLVHHSAIYYFHTDDPALDLAAALQYLSELSQRGGPQPATAMLRNSVDGLARKLAESYLHTASDADADTVLAAYAADHRFAGSSARPSASSP